MTGGAGYLGTTLVNALLAETSVEAVVAIDLAPQRSESGRVVSVKGDVRQSLAGLLAEHDVQAIVHLAYPMRHQRSYDDIKPYAEDATNYLLNAASFLGIGRVVLCSSTTVYGATPGVEQVATETTPRCPNANYLYAIGKDIMEHTAERHPRFGSGVVVVRPCTVVGPSADSYLFRRFFGTEVVVRDTDPAIQLLHERDFAHAILAVLRSDVTGPLNIAPKDWVRRAELFRLFQVRPAEVTREELSRRMATRWRDAREDIQSVQPEMIDLLNYSWLADPTRLNDLVGFTPAHSSLDSLLELFRGFRRRWKQQGPVPGAAG
ncbi:MAG TPA: NAD-dependent epimerase/dehydratase family protein [Polyangiaceae bacterium]|nr:NAD-dependent epimerase/dehydratase family protein [Polyangiaceae bacterium]